VGVGIAAAVVIAGVAGIAFVAMRNRKRRAKAIPENEDKDGQKLADADEDEDTPNDKSTKDANALDNKHDVDMQEKKDYSDVDTNDD